MTAHGDRAELWIASANEKKRAELERLLAPLGLRIRSLRELSDPPPMIEARPDFAGNAEIKATALARAVGAMAVGDDSGLCVDALGGEPGVRSARWAGPDATDADRIAKLLNTLADKPVRSARFVCHLCLAAGDGRVIGRFEDRCEGVILDEPVGTGGFGYDPVFAPLDQPPGTTRSFAELGAAEKDRISHRGRALRQLAAFLNRRRESTSP
ncbi:MAG: non-canonical purine NTP pyrophosphatase [Planctomycetota bacterium]